MHTIHILETMQVELHIIYHPCNDTDRKISQTDAMLNTYHLYILTSRIPSFQVVLFASNGLSTASHYRSHV